MGKEKKCFFLILFSAFFTILFIFSASSGFNSSTFSAKSFPFVVQRGPSYPPSFAFYISGGRGEKDQVFRLLLAVYHPRNCYLLHLSHEASDYERISLAAAVLSVPAVQTFRNVDVVGNADAITYMGSSTIAATLHAASVLLRLGNDWDWFVPLTAADYPLVTPDDLAHVFSSVPRDLNFIEHTDELGWKEHQRIHPIVVDPGIYLARKTNKIFRATQTRSTPESFKIFTGSPWVILTKAFIEFCILGWDNLPRTLLLYFTNVMLSEEGYFHSVICNSPNFQNLTVNSDLRYVVWDIPPGMEPHFLNLTDFDNMAKSGAAFARQFRKDDPVLSEVDRKILKRGRFQVSPGAWCSGRRGWWADPCTRFGDVNILNSGAQALLFRDNMAKILQGQNLQSCNC